MDFAKFLEEEENRKKGITPAPSKKNNFNIQPSPTFTPIPDAQKKFDGVVPPPPPAIPPENTTDGVSLQPVEPTPSPVANKLPNSLITTGKTTNISGPIASPAEAGIERDRNAIFKEQEEVVAQRGDLASAVASVEAESARQKAEEMRLIEEQQQKMIEERQAAESKAFDELTAKQKEVEGLKITDFWSNKTTSDKIIASLGLLVSAVGAGATSKENMAMKALNDNIERDFQAQKANIDNAFRSLQQQGYNYEQLKAMNDSIQQDFGLVKAAAYQKLQATLESQLKNLGIPQAEIEKNAALVDLKAKKNAIEQQIQEGLRNQVNTQIQEANAASVLGSARPSKMQEKIDEETAKGLVEWSEQGRKNSELAVKATESWRKRIEEDGAFRSTLGPIAGRIIPDWMAEQRAAARQQLADVIMPQLKQLFPGQVSDGERESIMDKIFDPKQSPEENLRKMDLFLQGVKDRAKIMDEKTRYFEENGTMQGYKASKNFRDVSWQEFKNSDWSVEQIVAEKGYPKIMVNSKGQTFQVNSKEDEDNAISLGWKLK